MWFLLLASLQANPIVNGQLESGFPAVVALGAELPTGPLSACTGTLIAPRVVLSAAHCKEGLPVDELLVETLAFFGPSVYDPDQLIGIEEMILHPDYRPQDAFNLARNDVAVLILREDASAEATWFRSEEVTAADVGTEVTSVGFGVTSSHAGDEGTKRSAQISVDDLNDEFILVLHDNNPTNSNLCNGDSGGPMYHYDVESDRYIQWAIHSYADLDCSSKSGSTRTDLFKDWILDQVEAEHGTRDICAANEWYDDGVCDDLCDEVDPDCLFAEGDTGSEEDEAQPKGSGGCSVLPVGRPVLGFSVLLLGIGRRRKLG